MAGNLKIIKRRIKTAKNIGQITKAMEMVAASKMRKAQKQALNGKPYAQTILEITNSLMKNTKTKLHPLLKISAIDFKPLLIIISTNRGLCGSLNLNLFRKIYNYCTAQNKNLADFDYITLGKKVLTFILRNGGNVIADFSDTLPFSENVTALTELLTQRFIGNLNSSVKLIYNDFINALTQQPIIFPILPLNTTADLTNNMIIKEKVDYLIEPSAKETLNLLLPYYLETQVRRAINEAEASEYSARMMAMKNATDNALELTEGLTLEYNKARQQEVTNEISDIVTAKISMEKK